jgi:hypothetical protein
MPAHMALMMTRFAKAWAHHPAPMRITFCHLIASTSSSHKAARGRSLAATHSAAHKLKARRVSSSLSVHFGQFFCLANLANFELVEN